MALSIRFLKYGVEIAPAHSEVLLAKARGSEIALSY